MTIGPLDASIGSVEDGGKTSDNPSDITGIKDVVLPHQPSTVALSNLPISVPTGVPSSGIYDIQS